MASGVTGSMRVPLGNAADAAGIVAVVPGDVYDDIVGLVLVL